MTPHYEDQWLRVYHGDARAVMAEMEPESVHMVCTSPPFWGLRDYGEPGQLGLEPTPEAYVESLVAVFREVRRVLRADGTVWLNLGDSYAMSKPKGLEQERDPGVSLKGQGGPLRWNPGTSHLRAPGLKPKDLVGIPWRVAFALQADGWYLRSDIIWSKPNPMPESVTDRPTKSHEYLFLLSKSARYYFDADAVREPHVRMWDESNGGSLVGSDRLTQAGRNDGGRESLPLPNPAGRNLRSVWTIATAPYPGAHFATFPPKLVEPCIKAGTSERGVCPECGAPWVREVERGELVGKDRGGNYEGRDIDRLVKRNPGTPGMAYQNLTTGWTPTCRHVSPLPPQPALVLDPFAGSGTTGMVAQSLSRRAILIDLSMDYLGQLMERNRDIPLGLETA